MAVTKKAKRMDRKLSPKTRSMALNKRDLSGESLFSEFSEPGGELVGVKSTGRRPGGEGPSRKAPQRNLPCRIKRNAADSTLRLDADPHAAARPLDETHGRVKIRRVEVGHFLLGDFL